MAWINPTKKSKRIADKRMPGIKSSPETTKNRLNIQIRFDDSEIICLCNDEEASVPSWREAGRVILGYVDDNFDFDFKKVSTKKMYFFNQSELPGYLQNNHSTYQLNNGRYMPINYSKEKLLKLIENIAFEVNGHSSGFSVSSK